MTKASCRRKSLFELLFQRDKNPSHHCGKAWQQAAVASWELRVHRGAENELGMPVAFKPQSLPPSDMLPPARPPNPTQRAPFGIRVFKHPEPKRDILIQPPHTSDPTVPSGESLSPQISTVFTPSSATLSVVSSIAMKTHALISSIVSALPYHPPLCLYLTL